MGQHRARQRTHLMHRHGTPGPAIPLPPLPQDFDSKTTGACLLAARGPWPPRFPQRLLSPPERATATKGTATRAAELLRVAGGQAAGRDVGIRCAVYGQGGRREEEGDVPGDGGREYWLVDPVGDVYEPWVQGFELADGVYEPMPCEEAPDGMVTVWSPLLQLEVRFAVRSCSWRCVSRTGSYGSGTVRKHCMSSCRRRRAIGCGSKSGGGDWRSSGAVVLSNRDSHL